MSTPTITTPDFATIKKSQRATWESGDYPRVGNTLQLMAERLVDTAQVHAGQLVLDAAGGQGNAALSAARRFAAATSVDYAVNLLEQGRQRAAAEQLPVTYTEGDVEALPFADAHFDVALSTVGVMFAPDHQRTADELVRVTKVGGAIGLANWTPDSLVGDIFRLVGRWSTPPAGVRPGVLWGTADHLRELFGDRVEWTSLEVRAHTFCFTSAAHLADWFCAYYGPLHMLSGKLAAEDRAAFLDELVEIAAAANRATDGTFAAPSAYLEAVGTRRA